MRKLVYTVVLAFATSSTWAHEFWIHANPFAPGLNRATHLTLHVGENFQGELVGVTAAHAASFKVHSRHGVEDLGKRIQRGTTLPALPLTLTREGTHVLAYESHPSEVVLEAEKFHEYLRMEGLEGIIRQREAAGTAGTPGRERFRRSAKALLRAGNKADGAFAIRTGIRMEIIPQVNPLSARPGDALGFALSFDGKPLAGALLKAWHRGRAGPVVVSSRSNEQGHASVVLPHAGPWLLNVVHMIPIAGSSELDWDSFWGSLTFELQASN